MVALSGFILIPSLFFYDFVPNITVIDLLDYVNISTSTFWFKFFLSLVLFLPFMGLVYVAVKALLGFKGKFKVGLCIFLLWIAAVIGLSVVSLRSLRSYYYWTKDKEEIVMEQRYDTLYINVSDKYKNDYNETTFYYNDENDFSALWSANSDGGKTSFYLLPQVEVVRTRDTGEIRMVYIRRAAGRNRYMAQEKLAQMLPKAFLRDSLLLLEPYIFDKDNKWSGELMGIKIYVPRGKTVKFEQLDGHHRKVQIRKRHIGSNIINIDIDDDDDDIDFDD
jgi:hypothetical protein